MKTKKCIKCGVRLHPTDWVILKEMNTLPICDNCSLNNKEINNTIIQNLDKDSSTIKKSEKK
jgi:hypothetical protein